MESQKNKIVFVVGLTSAFVGYSFWEYLWHDAFYHLISVAFVAYTFIIFNNAKSRIWSNLTFVAFISSCNALFDELKNTGCDFDYTEYFSLIIIIFFIFARNK